MIRNKEYKGCNGMFMIIIKMKMEVILKGKVIK